MAESSRTGLGNSCPKLLRSCWGVNNEGDMVGGQSRNLPPSSFVSVLSDDGVDAIDIFPEEVWKFIFGNLKEPKDLLNCKRTCISLEDILKPRECTWLFKDIFHYIFPYLSKLDCLHCRVTGKEWNNVIEGYLQNHGFFLPFDEVTNDGRHTTLHLPLTAKGFGWTEFSSTKTILKFVQTIQNPVKNPFLGRSVWAQYHEDLDDGDDQAGMRLAPRFWPAFFQFLSEYGKYIWYLSLGTFGSKNTVGRFLHIVRECLKRLPNLKSLHIFGWISDEEGILDNVDDNNRQLYEEMEEEDWVVNEDELPSYLERKPLPVMPCLERLEIEYMDDLPDFIYEYLITQHGNQLKCLQLTRWNFFKLDRNLPNLKELHMKVCSLSRLEKFFGRLKSPLGKLNLDFELLETEIDVPRLFRIISDSPFAETLQVLQMTVLSSPSPSPDDAMYLLQQQRRQSEMNPKFKPQPRLRAPNVQTIQLGGFNKLTMDFLLDLTSLKHFHIRHSNPTHRTEVFDEETVDIYKFMYSHKLYESNVWEKLPQLKVLSSEVFNNDDMCYVRKFYSRAMYDFLAYRNRL